MATVDIAGIGPRKTLFMLVILVGCFSVLWPRVLYPMISGATNNQIKPNVKDISAGIRQERPPHLRPEMLHPALRERGRAIPHPQRGIHESHIVPIVPRVVEGRPAPIPGMRPPMGGAGHMTPSKPASSPMGVLMPLYTIAIVVFFMYTMMKIIFKKPQESETLYEPIKSDPVFRKRVFGSDSVSALVHPRGKQAWTEENNTKLDWKDQQTIVTAIEGLAAEVDRRRDLAAAQAYQPNEHNVNNKVSESYLPSHENRNSSLSNGSAQKLATVLPVETELDQITKTKSEIHTQLSQNQNGEPEIRPLTPMPNVLDASVTTSEITSKPDETFIKQEQTSSTELKPSRDSVEKDKGSVKILGMEMTTSNEGGQKWSRPSTPVLSAHPAARTPDPVPPQSIYLEGALPHQSQLLVSESETHTETLPAEPQQNGTEDDPAVVLAGKMTLSVISLDSPAGHGPIPSPIIDEDDLGEIDEDLDVEVDLEDYTTASGLTQNNTHENHDASDEEEEVEEEEGEEEGEEEEEDILEEKEAQKEEVKVTDKVDKEEDAKTNEVQSEEAKEEEEVEEEEEAEEEYEEEEEETEEEVEVIANNEATAKVKGNLNGL